MLGKASLLALVLPLVHALQLSAPLNSASSGGSVTISWTTAPGDPESFSLYLVNDASRDSFRVATDVKSSAGTLEIQLPAVPSSNTYNLRAVDTGNISNVYSTSGAFAISGTITSSTVTSTPGATTTPALLPTPAGISTSQPASITATKPSTGAASPLSFSFTSSNACSFAAVLLCAVAGVFAVAI